MVILNCNRGDADKIVPWSCEGNSAFLVQGRYPERQLAAKRVVEFELRVRVQDIDVLGREFELGEVHKSHENRVHCRHGGSSHGPETR